MAKLPQWERCLRDVLAANPDVDRPTADRLMGDLFKRREALRATSGLDSADRAYAKAAQELGQEAKLAALVEKRSRAINVLRKQQRADFYDRLPKQEARAISILNVGSERPGAGFGRSVDAEQHALERKLVGPMVAELRAKGYDRVLRSAPDAFQRDIARNMWAISEAKAGDKPKLSGSVEAQEIAAIFNKYQESARLLQNDAGAFIRKMPGYVVRQSHDMVRIRRAGFDAWRAVIEPRLHERTFADLGPAAADRTAYLQGVWNALATGVHLREHGGGDWLGGFKGPANLAKKASAERSLHFKTADDWFDYNTAFGQGSLSEGVFGGLRRAAHNAGLMRTWGTNPEAAFLADIDQLKARAQARGEVAKVDTWLRQAEFGQVSGAANMPGNPSWAAFNAGARALISMAKLGGAVLSSLPDLPVQAAVLKHNGIGFLEGWGNGLQNFIRGRARGDQREIADLIGVGLDGMLGSIAARFSATDTVPGRISKLQNTFFRLNLLGWWTDAMSTGAGLMLSHNLARNLDRAHAALDGRLRVTLERYGIGKDQWAALQRAERRDADGRFYLTPEAVRDLPAAAIRPLAQDGSEAAIARARETLETSLRAYYTDQVADAITQPRARERAMVLAGTQGGTPVGEAVRYFTQFKAYPTTFVTRHLTREAARRDVPGIVHLIIGTTVMGYLSMSAKDLAKGKEPRDPGDVKTWGSAFVQGGGAGIYGDFIFANYNRFGTGPIETLGGPAVGTAAEFLKALAAARDGKAGDAGAKLFRAGVNATPFLNLFYTRAALDHLILFQIQEAMNPGYLRRFERSVEKDTGQKFILRPTEAVR